MCVLSTVPRTPLPLRLTLFIHGRCCLLTQSVMPASARRNHLGQFVRAHVYPPLNSSASSNNGTGVGLCPITSPEYMSLAGVRIPSMPPADSPAGAGQRSPEWSYLNPEDMTQLLLSNDATLNGNLSEDDLGNLQPIKSLLKLKERHPRATISSLRKQVFQGLNKALLSVHGLPLTTETAIQQKPDELIPLHWIGRLAARASNARLIRTTWHPVCMPLSRFRLRRETQKQERTTVFIQGRAHGGGRSRGDDRTKANAKLTGYPYIKLESRCFESVQRLLLWAVHGPPPLWKDARTGRTAEACVMHSCGNTLCCSLEHIRWGTTSWNNWERLNPIIMN